MAVLSELVMSVAARLSQTRGLDVGLGSVVDAIDSLGSSPEAAETAERLLRGRIRELTGAVDDLTLLIAQLQYLSGVMHLRLEGWGWRRSEIHQELRHDPAAGLAMWLGDWYEAASEYRTDALGRLAKDVELPSSAALLLDRARLAEQSLMLRDFTLALPMLTTGMNGGPFADLDVPSSLVRQKLGLLLLRIAILQHSQERVEGLLGRLGSFAPSSTLDALAARWHRLNHRSSASLELVTRASEDDPPNLDVGSRSSRRRV